MEITIPTEMLADVRALARGLVQQPVYARRPVVAMGTAVAKTLRALEDSNVVVLALTDNSVVTLPKAADCPGQVVTVVNVGADGAALVSISPQSTDAIVGSVVGVTGAGAATVVSSGGVVNKDWNNTKSSANKGDYTTLVSDGGTIWYIVGGVGEWASEA